MKLYRILLAISLLGFLSLPAQDYDESQDLSLEVDGLLFFRDNEFDSPLMKGYTLPGFRMLTDLAYKPTTWIKLSGGVWLMHYWGTNIYPNTSYIGIPNYTTDNTSRGLHALPYVSLEMSTPSGLSIILGDVHNRNGHGLLQQIYSPELALSADPEAGAQILYANRWIDIDAWLDWKTFIYNNSPYQENFFVGASARLKYNSPRSSVHLYSPIQALIEHRGGEIDTIKTESVQTFVNAAVGLGARINTGHRGVRAVKLEADFLYSWEQAGKVWYEKNGWGIYAQGALEFKYCDLHAGCFASHNYNTILGYSLWGVESACHDGLVLLNPQMIYAGLNYRKVWAQNFVLEAKFDLYQQLAADAYNHLTGESIHYGSKTSFGFELTMSFSPSFLLKRFHREHSQR